MNSKSNYSKKYDNKLRESLYFFQIAINTT